jgi:hypothetical protein
MTATRLPVVEEDAARALPGVRLSEVGEVLTGV